MCVFSAPAQRITPNVPITSTPEHWPRPRTKILKKSLRKQKTL